MIDFASKLRKWLEPESQTRLEVSEVRAGAVFNRFNNARILETARVVSVEDFESGIPHVRYDCCLRREDRVFENGPRILALPIFLERFGTAA